MRNLDYKKSRKAYLDKNPWVRNYTSSKGRAKQKGWRHELSVEDFKILWFRDKGFELKAPSIDRIDSSKGYIHGNCRFIERSLNSRLGSLGRPTSQKHKEQARNNLSNWFNKKTALGEDFQKTHCLRGHPFDEKNTIYRTNRRWRSCRACDNMRCNTYYHKKRQLSVVTN